MSNKNKLNHIVELFGGTIISVIVGVLTTPIITRLVSPEVYGQLNLFNLYDGIIVMVFCLGLDQALIRFYYRNTSLEYRKNLVRSCVIFPSLMLGIVGFTLIILCMIKAINFKFGIYGIIALVICSLCQLIRRFSFIILRLEYKTKWYSILHIMQKIIYVFCAILLLSIINGFDFEILTISTIFSVILVTIVSILSTKKLWCLSSNNKVVVNFKELLKFGLPFVLSMGLTTLFQAIDQFSINYFCGFYENGIYSSAMSKIHIFSLVQTTFNALWVPMSTEHYQKHHNSNKEFFVDANNHISFIMFFIGICIILMKNIIVYLLGSEYRLAVYIIPCLVFNPIMHTLSETTAIGINFSKKSYLHIIVSLVVCIVNIWGNFILVPVYGGRGAAISTGVSYIVFFVLRTIFSVREFHVSYDYRKIVTMTLILLSYSLYCTFNNGFTSLLYGCICLFVLFIVYKKEFIKLLEISKKIIDNIKSK